MNKQTKMWIGVAAVAAVVLYLYNKSKTTSFSGGTFVDDEKPKVLKGEITQRTAQGCVIYDGACMNSTGNQTPVGTILDWVTGTQGIVVANNEKRCIICPKSNTADGMPIRVD